MRHGAELSCNPPREIRNGRGVSSASQCCRLSCRLSLSPRRVPATVTARIPRKPFLQPSCSLNERSSMGKSCLVVALPGVLRLLGFVTEPLLSSAEIHGVEGEPARIDRAVPDVEHLSVVTWNIERGQQ